MKIGSNISSVLSRKRDRGNETRASIAAIASIVIAVASIVVPTTHRRSLALDLTSVQVDCVPFAGAQPPPANWGVAAPSVCTTEGAIEEEVVNWGRALGGVKTQIEPEVEVFDEALGQAAGEIRVHTLSTEVECTDLACSNLANVQSDSCTSLDCAPVDVVAADGCTSLDCPIAVNPDGGCTSLACALGTPEPVPTPIQNPRPVSLGPEWAPIEQWIPDILAAQQQVFEKMGVLVPTNVIMAEIRIESQGIMPSDANYAGAVGLLQVTPYSWGASGYDLKRATTDAAYSIYIGVTELAYRYLDSKNHNKENPGQPLPWENVIVGFFSGHYFPTGAADKYNSDFQYQEAFIRYFNELEAAGGFVGQTASTRKAVVPSKWLAGVAQPITGLARLWSEVNNPASTWPISQEFGPTDFSVNVRPEWYSYSLQYGFEQPGHTGLDIAMPAGTPLYAPTDSDVYCAGTFNSYYPEEGCSAFLAASGGPTSGRLQLKLASGDMLIYGHVDSSVVAAGQRVKAGQLIGYSGGFNGDHLHLEYRMEDPTISIGWRIIDPRLTPLNGQKIPTTSGPNEPTPTVTVTVEQQPPRQETARPTPEPTETPTEESTTVTTETVTVTETIEAPVETETPTPEVVTEPTVEVTSDA